MPYTVSNLLTDLTSVTHGTTINKIPNVYGLIGRAARDVLLDIDPKETLRRVPLPQVFDSVYDYPIPADVKGNAVMDLRPHGQLRNGDRYSQEFSVDFDATKDYSLKDAMTLDWENAVKKLRIQSGDLTPGIVVCPTDNPDGWTPAVTQAPTSPFSYPGIEFTLPPAPIPTSVYNTTLPAIDLSEHEKLSTIFGWTSLPREGVTAITLKWGSSAADYYSARVTTTQSGTNFQTGYNLLAFPWIDASVTGSPDASNITFLDVVYETDGAALTGVILSRFISTLGYNFDLLYYSKCMFRSPAGVFVETAPDSTCDSYLINLDTDSYNLLFDKTAFYVSQSLQGADAAYDASFWSSEYETDKRKYIARNPSERIVPATFYYRLPRPRYRK